ncbi:rRNA pseudouridine synthase [Alcaligenaceae bacterium]|nr:rRNA pseudouridine synthase [Alcaligenaceae bacterium]
MSESLRLNKYLADHYSCSRSQAENYIESGYVSVDGQVIEEPGFRVGPQQKVELAENARADEHRPATILLNKPAGYVLDDAGYPHDLIVSANHASDDPSGRLFLKRDLKGLIVPMPLAPQASGLIVFTQNPAIARKLLKDAARIEHEYVADVEGELLPDGLARLNHGLRWQGSPLPPAKVSWQNETRLRFALKNPTVDMIADMCRQVGLTLTGIKRIRIGRVPMARLASGQWRYLSDSERF